MLSSIPTPKQSHFKTNFVISSQIALFTWLGQLTMAYRDTKHAAKGMNLTILIVIYSAKF